MIKNSYILDGVQYQIVQNVQEQTLKLMFNHSCLYFNTYNNITFKIIVSSCKLQAALNNFFLTLNKLENETL